MRCPVVYQPSMAGDGVPLNVEERMAPDLELSGVGVL